MKATAYTIQAALILLWWVGLHLSVDFFAAFQFAGIDPPAFRAFFLPDVIIIAGSSLLRAYRRSSALEYVILGGFAYAFLYCLNATVLTASGYLPTTIMGLGLAYNGFLIFGRLSFRTSTTDSLALNLTKTLVQTACVWLITLGVFPYFILLAYRGEVVPTFGPRFWAALGMFVSCALLGLCSAWQMVRKGRGTPLPLDQTQELVTSGPYAYVRNPMAIAGIGQGIAISWWMASWPLLAYALLGALLWQFVVRPLEEENLAERFGAAYEGYRERVRCWIPF